MSWLRTSGTRLYIRTRLGEKISKEQLGAIIKKNKKHRITGNLPHSGAPCKIPPLGAQMILTTIIHSPEQHEGKLVNDLKLLGNSVTKVTTSYTLHCQGLKCCNVGKVPMLESAHVQACLKFSRNHLDALEDDWKNVMWSVLQHW